MSNYQANIITKNPATPTGPNANGSAPGIWRMNEVAYWIKQGVWPNANILTDPYFPYVTLLLSSTSLGNANNNLFVDSSGAFNPISRNGNATQGSFTPYGTNWSNYFASSSDYLQISGPATGTGTWTVEGWFYFTSFPGGPIFAQGTADTTSCWFLYLTSSGGLNFYSNGNISASSSGVVAANTWVHIALVSNSSNSTTYVNGTSVATGSYAGKVFTGGPFQLNRGYGGATSGNPCYQSNVRMVVGTAVYTANFTPPTSPLTAISGTTLLTCQSNRFRDASTNNYTVTRTGSVTVTEFAPFSPGYPGITYNQSDITNWSGYFNGSTDYLTVGSSSNLALGSGDFTVECWINPSSTPSQNIILDWRASNNNNLVLYLSSGVPIWRVNTASTIIGTAITTNAWTHLAVCRSGSTTTMYINGTSVGSFSDSNNYLNEGLKIGKAWDNNYWGGLLSNARIVKGTAVYTGNFTPPTTNLTAISGTSLLTLQNAAFTDNSTNNFVITPTGNVTVTGNSPFNTVGYWSNYFDGSGDWLEVPNNAAFAFGTGDLTLECWLFRTDTGGTGLWENRGSGVGFIWYVDGSLQVARLYNEATGTFYTSSVTVPVGQWVHLALTRTGNTLYFWMNGQAAGSSSWTTNITSSTTIKIGRSNEAAVFKGYISNYRVVKGTAVYTSAFTPPTTPLTAITNTSLLTCQNGRFIDNSTNAFTVTRNGDVSAQSFDPFYTSTIATNGGSMYFDGSGDYLAVPNAANLQFDTNNFTVECWFNSNVATTDVHNTIIGKWGTNFNTTGDWAIRSRFSNGNQAAVTLRYSSGWYDMTTGINIIDGAWHHLAFVRENSTTLKFYIDGVVRATRTISASDIVGSTATLSIGGPAASASGEAAMTGYVSNARITNGSALYTATFTPTTSVLTPSGNTTLLVNGMNAGIYDATAINDMETVNNVYVSTAVSKFNGSSIRFNSADYLKLPSTNELAFGTGDFTIEAWVYITANSGDWFIISSIGSGGLFFGQRAGSGWGYGRTAVAWDYNSGVNPVTNTWQHLAISRSGTSMRMFVDGTQIGTTQSSGTDYSLATGGTSVGSQGANYYLGGYIDDLRVTKGYARYTANFTPPTQPFPVY